jgi:hypothetical protein
MTFFLHFIFHTLAQLLFSLILYWTGILNLHHIITQGLAEPTILDEIVDICIKSRNASFAASIAMAKQ